MPIVASAANAAADVAAVVGAEVLARVGFDEESRRVASMRENGSVPAKEEVPSP